MRPGPGTVFDLVDRTDPSPAVYSEPTAAFLNRVAGDFWDQVRDLVESWATRVPLTARRDLLGRLRSPIDRQFDAAFWELYLHESFLRASYDVSVHPELPSSPRAPDFLVRTSRDAFYVEAKSIDGNGSGAGEGARREHLLDQLNRVRSPNFFFGIEILTVGPAAPPTRRLRLALEGWLGGLDPDEVANARADRADFDRFEWSESGWALEFRPFHVRVDARGRSDHRPVGMVGPGDGKWLDDSGVLRAAIKSKGSAYGELAHPLVIAINQTTAFHDDFDTLNALFGREKIQFHRRDPTREARLIRDTDGYWGYPGHWSHQQVAGMLLGRNIKPWSVGSAHPTYWAHPAPTESITPLNVWRRAVLEIDHVEQMEPAISCRAFFGLSDPWPKGDAFPADN